MADIRALLAQHLPGIQPYLQPEDLDQLARFAAVLAAEAGDEARVSEALSGLTTLLVLRLPVDHPFVIAAAGQLRSSGSAVLDRPNLGQIQLALHELTLIRPEPAAGDGSMPGSSGDAADAWLLAAPAFTEQQVRVRGGDPGSPSLIRLDRPDGPVTLPAFQFGPDGAAKPVVAEINLLLDAAGDPWGVADWWLGENAWLDGIPADLLGQVPDLQLVLAAQAEIPAE
jgi:hypothetical protein